jgi:hypothetical protein
MFGILTPLASRAKPGGKKYKKTLIFRGFCVPIRKMIDFGSGVLRFDL